MHRLGGVIHGPTQIRGTVNIRLVGPAIDLMEPARGDAAVSTVQGPLTARNINPWRQPEVCLERVLVAICGCSVLFE
jgi:hypothetical protein